MWPFKSPEVVAALLCVDDGPMQEQYLHVAKGRVTCLIVDRMEHRHFKIPIHPLALTELDEKGWLSVAYSGAQTFYRLSKAGKREIEQILASNLEKIAA